jgi:hypothetical protein
MVLAISIFGILTTDYVPEPRLKSLVVLNIKLVPLKLPRI